MTMHKKLITLIVLDGYGYTSNKNGNAIDAANKPNMDKYMNMFPHTFLHASGIAVGLPEGQMGNSEVGHTNIGAGRVVYQELTRITKSINDGDFFENQQLVKAMGNCKHYNSSLHLMGLLSDGGVHSHIEHLFALLRLAKQSGLDKVFIHCFFDGRDVLPNSGINYVKELEEHIASIGVGKIATVMGRYYAMDRDNRWERVKLAYDAIAQGEGLMANSAQQATLESYNREEFDEFVKPTVIMESNNPTALVQANDSIIFFNFRPDRAREITRAFTDKQFNRFERKQGIIPVHFVCMTQYDKTIDAHVAYAPQLLNNTFGQYISNLGYTQLRIAETEKYAHVTFFFNGGIEEPYPKEDRALISSPKVATYDLKPEMSAYEVTEEVLKRIKSRKYDVIILNFANADMVGHTGVFDAAKKAIEAVDECIGKVVSAILEQDGVALITADHGNAERMIDEITGEPYTAHTTNIVPLIAVGLEKGKTLKEGSLRDLAPTMLELMGIDKPAEMTGYSLISE